MIEHTRTTRRAFLAHTLALGTAGLAIPDLSSSSEAVAAPQGEGWQIGIYTRPWSQHVYGVALDAIAEAGYKYVGLMGIKGKHNLVLSAVSTLDEAQKAGEEARKRGLKIVSVYTGNWRVDKTVTERSVQQFKGIIDNTAACGCGHLLLGGIGAPQEEAYYGTVRECCDYAAEKNVTITLKPHGVPMDTGPACRKRCEMVGKQNFGVWYDPGNILFYSNGKLNPVQDAATVDGLVRGMSVKDYRAPRRVDVTPGTGEVNFPAVMARLRQGGFTSGPLVIECLAPGDLKALAAEARKAREFVEQLVG